MSEVNVLIVEDEPMVAEDIAEALNNIDFKVSAVVYTEKAALEELLQNTPDIAILDINLKNGKEGIQIAEEINRRYHIPFVYLTAYSDKQTLEMAQHTQPAGYLVKPFTEKNLFATSQLALLNHGRRLKDNFSLPALDKINTKLTAPISDREYELLAKIFEGLTTKQMAEQLFIAASTVKTHIRNIYLKLDVINRSGAIARIRELMLR
ncbi:MAG: response regulator [Chitinophagaceae bacterium]|nr:response regulator [Chitinophagaceae bacterium]